jgi:hypothetical protein
MHGILLFARIVGLPMQKLHESDFEIETCPDLTPSQGERKANGLVRIVAIDARCRSAYWSRPR